MRKNKLRLKTKIIAILLVVVVSVVVIEANFSEVVSNAIYYRSTLVMNEVVESAIKQVLASEDFGNDDIVRINYNSDNDVSAIEIQSDTLNTVRNDISSAIISKLEQIDSENVDIPLNAIIGSNFFFSEFPVLNFKISPTGYLETRVVSAFEDSGINQTIHKTYIDVKIEFYCIFPFYDIKNSCQVQYILTETIIVGDIPQSYTQVITEDSELISDLYDYAIE